MSYKVGDQVYLISGGPEMTVVVVGYDGDITCTWYSSKSDGFQREIFPPAALKPVPEPPTTPNFDECFKNG
ncbi:DUF2158 domain-containing protein [Oceanimonas baumannii]|uniref:YodC family protein n=1 Tax=Oceanimonas baumannii TaxID=129578 RepID=UPI001D195B22|nr:DUF2158 domain-containing protein [Oceanimonas baumannii]MCC4266178.1 DUF2158 domain-containing protein [Oceanimonas baumannii]